MKRKAVNTLLLVSIPAIVLHIASLSIVPVRGVGFIGILLSVILLIGLNIFAWRLETRIMRRLSREADYVSWETHHQSAEVIAQQDARQERKIYKVHHDIYNHIAVAAAMLRENDTEGAVGYLEKLRNQMSGKI